MVAIETPRTTEDFKAMVGEIEGAPEYARPAAFALGLATVESTEATDATIGVQFTRRNYAESYGTAAVFAAVIGSRDPEVAEAGLATGEYLLSPRDIEEANRLFRPFAEQPGHDNIDALFHLAKASGGVHPRGSDPLLSNPQFPVLSVVRDWDDAPASVGDTYLRLYGLSERKREPNTINLDGAFGKLPNVVVTEATGLYTPEKWNEIVDLLVYQGISTAVRVLDKFPRMTDHIVPSGVRIADPGRVRLGAFLGEGTTVMHEGFANFNAGTLGASMVEGRISAGVVVGDGSDVGGGASIMGTLSGGGKEKIAIGERCLLEANSGIGISLGDDCRVEAGTYVKSTTPVELPDGQVVKAAELSGASNMMLRRNARSGVIEMVPNNGGEWRGLNADLHTKQ